MTVLDDPQRIFAKTLPLNAPESPFPDAGDSDARRAAVQPLANARAEYAGESADTLDKPENYSSRWRAMNSSIIENIIRSFHGQCYDAAGAISGFFDDPAEARACAQRIAIDLHKQVEICGSQLTVWM